MWAGGRTVVRAKVGSDLTSIAVQDGLDIRITVAVGPAVEVREHRRDEQRGADDHLGKTISRAEWDDQGDGCFADLAGFPARAAGPALYRLYPLQRLPAASEPAPLHRPPPASPGPLPGLAAFGLDLGGLLLALAL